MDADFIAINQLACLQSFSVKNGSLSNESTDSCDFFSLSYGYSIREKRISTVYNNPTDRIMTL